MFMEFWSVSQSDNDISPRSTGCMYLYTVSYERSTVNNTYRKTGLTRRVFIVGQGQTLFAERLKARSHRHRETRNEKRENYRSIKNQQLTDFISRNEKT